jgi:multidrug efflux pump subunit AcrA (membrane-fusion protein)
MRAGAIALATLIVLVVPLKRIEVEAPFVLEPVKMAVLRAQVPGTVDSVQVREGQKVSAGDVLAQMSNLTVLSRVAESKANVATATAQLRGAELAYGETAAARNAAQAAASRLRDESEQARQLTIQTPISGVVTTARPTDLAGTYVESGTELLQVANTSSMLARIFIAEPEMRRLPQISSIRVRPNSELLPRNASVVQLSSAPEIPQSDLVPASALLGTRHASYYVLIAGLDDSTALMPGTTGTAKLFGPRHSLAYFGWESVRDFFARKLW